MMMGTLTEEGRTRYQKAVDNAKRELSYARADHVEGADAWRRQYKEDKEYYTNKRNSPDSKSAQERYLKEQFGNDWKDTAPTFLKDVFKIDDPYKWAKDEMVKQRDNTLAGDKQNIKDSLKEARIFEKRYSRLSSMKLEDLSKRDVEQLDRFINGNMKNELFFLDDDARFKKHLLRKKESSQPKREQRKEATKKAVKEYNDLYEKTTAMYDDQVDKEWKKADEMYKGLGKNRISRIRNAAKNKSPEAKAYNKQYEKASSLNDKADASWERTQELYKKTGKTPLSRIINNIKYQG